VETERRRPRRRLPRVGAAFVVATGLVATACGYTPVASATSPRRPTATVPVSARPTATVPSGASTAGRLDDFYRLPSPLVAAPPGAIIRSSVIDSSGQLPAGATAYRVLYHSQSISGGDVPVSGVVVVPGGTPPPEGFPIVSWAHGTTGVADSCAPSLAGFGSIAYLNTLLRAQMIVVATDFEGLGTPGVHPYLVGQSEAQGVLDAARAARNLVGRAASNTVVVLGYSQGGQAALFAGQIAQSYAPELFVAGVAAVAPVTTLTELAPTVPDDRTDQDAGFAAMGLYAWSATYGNFGLASVLTREGLHDSAVIASSCVNTVGATFDRTDTDLLFKPGWSALAAVRADDAANEPGGTPISAPVLVVQGTDDTLVPYRTTTDLVEAMCRRYDTVRYVPVPGAGHQGALTGGQATIVQWIRDRVDGRAVTDACPGTRTGAD
jgi:pimeloyl-ACP methyl ester carboxylesterase